MKFKNRSIINVSYLHINDLYIIIITIYNILLLFYYTFIIRRFFPRESWYEIENYLDFI